MAVNLLSASTTPASNTTVGGVSIAEGTAAANINNAIRAAVAGIKELTDVLMGAKTTAGSANAYTLTSGLSLPAYAAGTAFLVKANHTNTGAATIAVDGLGAKAITDQTGTALAAGMITSGSYYLLAYEAGDDDFTLVTPALNTNPLSVTTINVGNADTTIARVAAGIISVEGSTVAMLGTEDQTLAGGARVTIKDLGTVSSGTTTPDPGDRPMQKLTNGGAFTLAPGSNNGSYLLDITNNGSAGAITTSGWTKVTGSSFTTTNGHKFRCHCSVGDAGSLLSVQALQ